MAVIIIFPWLGVLIYLIARVARCTIYSYRLQKRRSKPFGSASSKPL